MKAAVILAANPRNSGMYSVDQAAASFFSAHGMEHSFFCAQQKEDHESFGKTVTSRLASLDQLADYSHVVYWGDFLNNPVYGAGDFAKRDVTYGLSSSTDAAFQRWQDIFAPSDRRHFSKLISAGNNFQHLTEDDAQHYSEPVASLLDNFDLILPRDPASLGNLQRLASPDARARIAQGIDCAFLLPPLRGMRKQDTFVYQFGRSKFADTSVLVSQVEKDTGLRGVALPNWLKLGRGKTVQTFHNQIEKICESRFVLTDIYHLCVNSMNHGVPVFGVGKSSSKQEGTLGDFKKAKLFEMFGLKDAYAEKANQESEADFFGRVAEKIRLAGSAAVEGENRLAAARRRFQADIAEALAN